MDYFLIKKTSKNSSIKGTISSMKYYYFILLSNLIKREAIIIYINIKCKESS